MAPASPTWSTPWPGLWVREAPRRCAAERCKMSSLPAPATARLWGAPRSPSLSIMRTVRCQSNTRKCQSPAGCSAMAPANTKSMVPKRASWISRSCSLIRALAARCILSSAKASFLKSSNRGPKIGALISKRQRVCSNTAAARKRRSANSPGCRATSTGSPTSPPNCDASSSRWGGRPRSRRRRRRR